MLVISCASSLTRTRRAAAPSRNRPGSPPPGLPPGRRRRVPPARALRPLLVAPRPRGGGLQQELLQLAVARLAAEQAAVGGELACLQPQRGDVGSQHHSPE